MTDEKTGKRAGGRPRKAVAEQRTERLSGIRLTTAERAHIEAQAERAGLPVAEFARRAILGIRIEPRRSSADERMLFEINRIGVNLAQLVKALHFGQTPLVAEIEATVADVRGALERLAGDGS